MIKPNKLQLITLSLIGIVLALGSFHFNASAAPITGTQQVMVLRVYFADYTANSRYTQVDVEGFFDNLDKLWRNTSYDKINIGHQVTPLYQLPDVRSDYIDDFPDGDLSNGGKFMKVVNDAIANAPSGLDWSDIASVMVVMAEPGSTQFHRGQANGSCTVAMGPGGTDKNVGCAIFSENPAETDVQVWGRWAHEVGHAFQDEGPAHPSNYNNEFELMDSNYPGQTGVFEKLEDMGFPGWLPPSKYLTITPGSGGASACLWAMEYDPEDSPNLQAVKIEITGSLYYMVSVRRKVLGDELSGRFSPPGIPDEGVLIERVSEGSNPWVEVKGKAGDRNKLWKNGDSFTDATDGIVIAIDKQVDPDNYCLRVAYDNSASQPDVMLERWSQPPGDTWETTDIWVDNPINGYGTYRYGWWNDLDGNLVPKGNGDDPGIGQVNRLYARVRNVGTAPATDVEVTWQLTDPPGLGISGANGWASVGTVDKTDFATLANIAPGAFTDVYVEWIPDFPVTDEDLVSGQFYFHTCVRVKLNQVAGETVFGNQDGDGEQENFAYFQATPPDEGDSAYKNVISLHNNDLIDSKFFNLSYESDLPDAWHIDINGGDLGIELGPGAKYDIPVTIKPDGPMVVGQVFGVDIEASSSRLLASDLDPKDIHHEFAVLGGVRVESAVLHRPKIGCDAVRDGDQIIVTGQLKANNFEKLYDLNQVPVAAIQGIGNDRTFIPNPNIVTIEPDGSFIGRLSWKDRSREDPAAVTCLFAGTTLFTSAGSGYVEIVNAEPTPIPAQFGPTPTPQQQETSTPMTNPEDQDLENFVTSSCNQTASSDEVPVHLIAMGGFVGILAFRKRF
jgi:hypothetical protein